MKYNTINEVALAFLKQEFEKNRELNYLVRCSDVGDGELDQILDYNGYIIVNLNIPEEQLIGINQLIDIALHEDDYELLNTVANTVKEYVTFSELYKSDFNIWEQIVLENYNCNFNEVE
jgi:hypothetical protein